MYAATWFQTKVAVKYLTKEGGEAEKEFLNEIKVMAESFHQNIVTFYSACMEPHRVRQPRHGARQQNTPLTWYRHQGIVNLTQGSHRCCARSCQEQVSFHLDDMLPRD